MARNSKSDCLHPSGDGRQPNSDGHQPKSDGLQETDNSSSSKHTSTSLRSRMANGLTRIVSSMVGFDIAIWIIWIHIQLRHCPFLAPATPHSPSVPSASGTARALAALGPHSSSSPWKRNRSSSSSVSVGGGQQEPCLGCHFCAFSVQVSHAIGIS